MCVSTRGRTTPHLQTQGARYSSTTAHSSCFSPHTEAVEPTVIRSPPLPKQTGPTSIPHQPHHAQHAHAPSSLALPLSPHAPQQRGEMEQGESCTPTTATTGVQPISSAPQDTHKHVHPHSTTHIHTVGAAQLLQGEARRTGRGQEEKQRQ